MPSGPVRKPEIARPGLNGSVVVSAPCETSRRLPTGSLNTIRSFTLRSSASAREPRAKGNLVLLEARAERVERGGVGDLPAVEAGHVDACPRAPRDAACGRPCGTSRCPGSCRPAACRGTGWRRPSSLPGSWCEGRYSPASARSSQVSCGNNARFARIVPRRGGATERFDMPCTHRPQTPNFHGRSSAKPGPVRAGRQCGAAAAVRARAWASAQFGRVLALRSAEGCSAAERPEIRREAWHGRKQ